MQEREDGQEVFKGSQFATPLDIAPIDSSDKPDVNDDPADESSDE